MLCIRIAELNIGIDNRYEYVERFCRGYIIDVGCDLDFTVTVTEDDIDAELAIATIPVSRGYAETICVYRAICDRVLRGYDGFLLHAADVEFEGRGYAFSAKSGTGKSTHIALWKKVLGNGVTVVNGDKPIVRYKNGEFIAYGTPWCGKEGLGNNTSVALRALCFLERAGDNSIARVSPSDAVARVFNQVILPDDVESFDKMSTLLDRLLGCVPCYLLGCNMEDDAAMVAYNGMK